MFVPLLILSRVFRLIKNHDEDSSEILFYIKCIIGVFTLKSRFNGFLFVLRKRVYI